MNRVSPTSANRLATGSTTTPIPPSRRFGTCYLGVSLCGAIAETVLHDLMPEGGHFIVPPGELESKHVIRFQGGIPRLAKLTGVSLKRRRDRATSPLSFPTIWRKRGRLCCIHIRQRSTVCCICPGKPTMSTPSSCFIPPGVDSGWRCTRDLHSTPDSMLPSLPCTFAGREGNRPGWDIY